MQINHVKYSEKHAKGSVIRNIPDYKKCNIEICSNQIWFKHILYVLKKVAFLWLRLYNGIPQGLSMHTHGIPMEYQRPRIRLVSHGTYLIDPLSWPWCNSLSTQFSIVIQSTLTSTTCLNFLKCFNFSAKAGTKSASLFLFTFQKVFKQASIFFLPQLASSLSKRASEWQCVQISLCCAAENSRHQKLSQDCRDVST